MTERLTGERDTEGERERRKPEVEPTKHLAGADGVKIEQPGNGSWEGLLRYCHLTGGRENTRYDTSAHNALNTYDTSAHTHMPQVRR